jgi:hypothetical protein
MEEQVRLRGNQMDKLEAIEKEEEERSRQVHDQAMQLQGAAEARQLLQWASPQRMALAAGAGARHLQPPRWAVHWRKREQKREEVTSNPLACRHVEK